METPRKVLLRSVLGELDKRLKALGFFKKKGNYVREFGKDCYGSVFLNTATHLPQQGIGFNPIIPLPSRPVEALLFDLVPDCSVVARATLLTAAGYITPEDRFLSWVFDPNVDSGSELEKIVVAIRLYAVPFMEAHKSLESIMRELENRRFTDIEGKRFRLPLAYVLAGFNEKALRFVEEQLAEIKDRSDVVAAEYRKFAEALEARVSTRS